MAFNLAGPQTSDTVSTNGGCTYPATPLGSTPFNSPVIRVGQQPLQYYADGKGIPDQVPGTGAPGCQTHNLERWLLIIRQEFILIRIYQQLAMVSVLQIY